MQIEIDSSAVAAKVVTVLWTAAMWVWMLIEAISALRSDEYGDEPTSLVVAVESSHVVVLWFLVFIPLVAGTIYLKKQEEDAPTAESSDSAGSPS